ncbi:RNA methyltransferase [Legionella birminghamensis]|uniref:tRNA (cytidine/uridine-2'-O-)-methyltransferase TrmJ n=1 Tax=Legionella birminghamensis TaxID=28083 RepID=A0A378IJI6_9GAMM|nr:RNA methyltransferase [Legionella birminghamensis]KTC69517.1 RNA methyltransferase [Legionella birminghamensis]STX32314.1 RNA methyltransferase [Legionella birminghamensis]
MNFSAIRIVLVGTTHPGNIGSAARAMKTMGLSRLYLVNPKSFPDLKACEMAAGADDILDNAIVCQDLEDALRGCQLVLATSARPRGIALPGLIPGEAAELVAGKPDETEVAILFGREHAGLTNEELLRSQFHINIPSNSEYSSLNLAQAVQIIAYELRMKLLSSPKAEVALREDREATVEEVEQFYGHLTEVMLAIDFLRPDNPGRLQQRLRRLFNRVGLEHMEVNILRGILSHMQNALKWAKINRGS